MAKSVASAHRRHRRCTWRRIRRRAHGTIILLPGVAKQLAALGSHVSLSHSIASLRAATASTLRAPAGLVLRPIVTAAHRFLALISSSISNIAYVRRPLRALPPSFCRRSSPFPMLMFVRSARRAWHQPRLALLRLLHALHLRRVACYISGACCCEPTVAASLQPATRTFASSYMQVSGDSAVKQPDAHPVTTPPPCSHLSPPSLA